MSKFYSMEIAGCKRDLELFPVTDNLYIAAFILFGDVEVTVAALAPIKERYEEIRHSQELLDSWYSIKAVSGNFVSPDETADKIASITREQIIAAAKTVSLHTVYRLLPKEVK